MGMEGREGLGSGEGGVLLLGWPPRWTSDASRVPRSRSHHTGSVRVSIPSGGSGHCVTFFVRAAISLHPL